MTLASSTPSSAPIGEGIRPIEPPARGRYGNALVLRADPLGTLLDWQARYGKVVKVHLRRWTQILNDPEDVKQVLVAHQSRYHKGENLKVANAVFGQGLLTSEEPLHLIQRHLMQPAFHRDVLRSYGDTMVERTARLASSWSRPQEVDVHTGMMRLTLDIAAKTMFGVDDVAEAEALGQAIETAQEVFRARTIALWSPPEWFPSPNNLRAWKALDVMDGLVLRIIAERRKDPGNRNDLLSLLLRATDDAGRGMDDAQLRDEALTLLLAGHETTASGLSFTLHLIARYPEVEQRLRQELRDVLQGRPPTAADVPRLPYTDRVFSEAIRLYPPAWVFTRLAMEDDLLPSGVPVPAGSEVWVSPWAMQRNPQYYPDPERFDPDRFLPAARDARPQFSYFPFGGGSRRCIGEPFAKMEAVLVLATLLSKVRLASVAGSGPVPEPLFTLRPKNGVRMRTSPAS
jgi:cytochrome P450